MLSVYQVKHSLQYLVQKVINHSWSRKIQIWKSEVGQQILEAQIRQVLQGVPVAAEGSTLLTAGGLLGFRMICCSAVTALQLCVPEESLQLRTVPIEESAGRVHVFTEIKQVWAEVTLVRCMRVAEWIQVGWWLTRGHRVVLDVLDCWEPGGLRQTRSGESWWGRQTGVQLRAAGCVVGELRLEVTCRTLGSFFGQFLVLKVASASILKPDLEKNKIFSFELK